jgi:hypothetical protein
MGRDPSDDRRLLLGLTPFVTIITVAVIVGLILYQRTRTRPLRVVAASLVADPADYKGPCPTIIRFHGTIRVEGRGEVSYKFGRSDGAQGPVQKADVSSASPTAVESTWTLGRQPETPFEAWQTLEILTPRPTTSERASFRLTCVP